MKSTTIITFLISLILFTACSEKELKTPNTAMTAFETFKNKQKFSIDTQFQYTGVQDPKLRSLLSEKINLSANDFQQLAEKGSATEKEYQDAIKKGLDRFSESELDTEDKERVCLYYEELMDIVGLESSGGHLNTFMYGFDPTGK